MTATGGGPFAGVRVVDLTSNVSGPYGTMVLAQQGADVIKVERPPGGDIIRQVGSGRGGVSSYFVNTNWGKRSVALDYNEAGDREVLERLIATADVLVENFRPSVMARFGLSAEVLLARHPRLIYAAIRGFPSHSSYAEQPAYDHVIQVMTGFASNQADLKTGTPALVQQAVIDKVTGLTAAQAISAALFERERTGRGQLLEIPMLHAALALLWPDAAANSSIVGDFEKLPTQSRTFRLTQTADGYLVFVALAEPQWNGLLRAVGFDHLIGDPQLSTPQQRARHGADTMRAIAGALREKTTAEVIAALTANGVPCGPVVAVDDLPEWIESISPGYLVHEEHPQLGEVIHPRPAVTFDEDVVIRPAPAVGEHTDEVLAELP